MRTKKNNIHLCTICSEPYKKQDFIVCPHCGCGGNTTPKTWKPTKQNKKEFLKNLTIK